MLQQALVLEKTLAQGMAQALVLKPLSLHLHWQLVKRIPVLQEALALDPPRLHSHW